MDISIMTGIIITPGLVVFALIYSRSNNSNRSCPVNNEGASSSATAGSSSSGIGCARTAPYVGFNAKFWMRILSRLSRFFGIIAIP